MITNAIEIRQRNKERIREAIQKKETCTKADIVKETDLSMATCSTMLNEMLESREILKVDQTGAGIGRPSDLFSYNRNYLHALCICIYAQDSSNTIDLAVADAMGNVIESRRFPCPIVSSETIETLVAEQIASDPLICTVGLGVPGVVVGNVIEFCTIKTLEKVDFPQLFGKRFSVDVVVRNDMNAITYYLYHSQESCHGDFAALYFPSTSSGCVSSGFIVGGHALLGSSMLAGEVSHVAEVFGIPLCDQEQALLSREPFRKFAAQILLTICCTINPSNVVVMGNGIDAADVVSIRAHCLHFLTETHMPDIQIANEIFENYAKGLIRLTLDSVLFPFIV